MSEEEKAAPGVQVVDMKEPELEPKEPKLVGLRGLSQDEWGLLYLIGIGCLSIGILMGFFIFG
jgi:hypothetical protein